MRNKYKQVDLNRKNKLKQVDFNLRNKFKQEDERRNKYKRNYQDTRGTTVGKRLKGVLENYTQGVSWETFRLSPSMSSNFI